MEFKIDTKTGYSIVTPLSGAIDANLAEELRRKLAGLAYSGSGNFIIDLSSAAEAEEAALAELLQLHESSYADGRSLVFVHLQDAVTDIMKRNDWQYAINIAPTLPEAVDIISMEILERDLFNEEDEQ